ncbi:MAG: class I SAM-dependent methyltransferase [Bacteroidales bacterium]
MNLYYTVKYLKYMAFSSHKKGHGIHSPFLYKLISEVFRNKSNPDVVLNIESERRKLFSDTRVVQVTDFGAGPARGGGDTRKVSIIAKRASVSRKYGKLLSNLAAEFGSGAIIELGTCLGISTMYMASVTNAKVHTIEGSKELCMIAEENIKRLGLDNVVFHNGKFSDVLPELRKAGITPGLVFIDGDHRKERVIEYFRTLKEMSTDRTVLVFDDIHLSKQMGEAWSEISSDPSVRLAIDLNRMGLIFFRKGLSPSRVIIRY